MRVNLHRYLHEHLHGLYELHGNVFRYLHWKLRRRLHRMYWVQWMRDGLLGRVHRMQLRVRFDLHRKLYGRVQRVQ